MRIDPLIAELHRIRVARGLTLLDIYERGGPSPTALSNIERGKHIPVLHTVRQLLRALDLDVVVADVALAERFGVAS
jgi:transcriptional regulator with XRE-family HTH domain